MSNRIYSFLPVLIIGLLLVVLLPEQWDSFEPENASTVAMTPDLELELWHSGLGRLVDITHAGDGSNRVFVVDANGYIRIIDSLGNVLAEPFLDIDTAVFTQNERGMLGLAFHPDYETNGFFFVNYTDNEEDTRVSRFSVDSLDPNKADVSSEKILFDIPQPYENHNGGDLAFSPDRRIPVYRFGRRWKRW